MGGEEGTTNVRCAFTSLDGANGAAEVTGELTQPGSIFPSRFWQCGICGSTNSTSVGGRDILLGSRNNRAIQAEVASREGERKKLRGFKSTDLHGRYFPVNEEFLPDLHTRSIALSVMRFSP